ncbi:PREDICTED: phosphorylase b kinase gamma catalytic chain, skeletal muscle/heart isoform-like isoform X2 [Branchiostoma belcheri]|uniref:phosphorylase kinase n=1 Tax=Branchiostoma belcheri TaxID=7741 RepID=A0A6P4XTJ3_BRABE|nr:PREDICTED: phosphorylase b kinase gamma catalytic chain, skeletal muscle/heart isoform-like isoform X2 [Branchiostoma belcheri]
MTEDHHAMTREMYDDLPEESDAKEFYAKYEPKEVLGRGLSSVVRRCVRKTDQQEFAVKIIDVTEQNWTEDRDSVMKEVAILQTVSRNANIIQLVDVFECTTFIFLVFELIKGGELFDYLTEVVELSERETRFVMRQLFEVVQFLHELNIVHRDLKPENILIQGKLEIKVSDFGFAVRLKEGELLKELCGTPGYLAPEVLKCSMIEGFAGYGKEVDMWACGVIMYTLLAGQPPFWHRKQMMLLRNIMEGNYNFDGPEWEDISHTSKDLISHLLIVDPKNRFTAEQALQHPFFESIEPSEKGKFDAKSKFKAAIAAVCATQRLQAGLNRQQVLTFQNVAEDPYRVRGIRRVIDGCAFRIYGHWVKKGEDQNRAALFENFPKRDATKKGDISKTWV